MKWLCLVACVGLLGLGGCAAVGICDTDDNDVSGYVTVTVSDVPYLGVKPIVMVSQVQRSNLSPFSCHNAVLVQRMEGDVSKESIYAEIHVFEQSNDTPILTESTVCSDEHCVSSYPSMEECTDDVVITASLADRLKAEAGDTLRLSRATVRAEVEYRMVDVLGSRSKQPKREKVADVVPIHPMTTYLADENVYCVETPYELKRISSNSNRDRETPPPCAAEVIGILPGKYAKEIVVKYTQVSSMNLPIPYPFLTLSSYTDRSTLVEDVNVRLWGAPPYTEGVIDDHIGFLYKEESKLWKQDSMSRGLHRPYYETIDGYPDDGVLITSSLAEKLNVSVGEFVVIEKTLSHDAYTYKKEIDHLKRQLKRETESGN